MKKEFCFDKFRKLFVQLEPLKFDMYINMDIDFLYENIVYIKCFIKDIKDMKNKDIELLKIFEDDSFDFDEAKEFHVIISDVSEFIENLKMKIDLIEKTLSV